MKQKIINALKLNKLAYDAVRENFKRGMSEADIKQIILTACKESEDYSGDIVGGVRTSFIEGDATDYVLKEGDALILDLQFKLDGVWTDTTRTFFVGKPSKEQREAYNLCLKAKQAGESALKSGVKACEVFGAVKTAFSPFEDKFPHHAGHIFGLERLIQPQFLPEIETLVKENSFATLEPGIYFENNFGIRVEDNYFVTNTGVINLFDYSTDLEDFIL